MKDIGVKLKTYFQSKSFADFIYLVTVIVLVTMIKDMIMSMYKKRQDRQWLDRAFNKSNNTKTTKEVREGFNGEIPLCPSPAQALNVCDRIKYLICEDNFQKIMKLMDNVDKLSTNLKFNSNVDFGSNVTISSSLSCHETAFFDNNLECDGPVRSRILSCSILTCSDTVTCSNLSTNKITNNSNNIISLENKLGNNSNHLKLELHGSLDVKNATRFTHSNRYINSYNIKTTDFYPSLTLPNYHFYDKDDTNYFRIAYISTETKGMATQLHDVEGETYFKKTAGSYADKE